MKFIDCKNLKIAYIGGGSRSWARVFMNDLALEEELGGEISLYDIDELAAHENREIGNVISAMPRTRGKWDYTAANTLEQALEGANFVIISILPGTFKEMRSDVHLPERNGIYQSVGDTTGPGGIIRGLRAVPIFDGFGKAIKKICPDAWVINFTNPMSLCVSALYNAFHEIKAFGCCHEVFGAQELLAQVVSTKTGIPYVDKSEIFVNVLGLNHFTWFDKASWNNYDLMELYKGFADEFFEDGFCGDYGDTPEVFTCNNRVKFDLFKKYGLIAAAGDRHLAEFMHGDMYLKDPQTAESWGFYLTSIDWREEDLKAKLDKTKRLVSGEEQVELTGSGEEGVLLIKALCGLTRVVSNVNLPNSCRQIVNIPMNTIVETNAVFSYNDVRPVYAGAIPENIMELMRPHIENQETVLNAALNFDREKVYKAFEIDPLSRGKSDTKLVHEMIKNTVKYLPEEWADYK